MKIGYITDVACEKKFFNNTKITMSIEEFNNTFTLDEAIKELN